MTPELQQRIERLRELDKAAKSDVRKPEQFTFVMTPASSDFIQQAPEMMQLINELEAELKKRDERISMLEMAMQSIHFEAAQMLLPQSESEG